MNKPQKIYIAHHRDLAKQAVVPDEAKRKSGTQFCSQAAAPYSRATPRHTAP